MFRSPYRAGGQVSTSERRMTAPRFPHPCHLPCSGISVSPLVRLRPPLRGWPFSRRRVKAHWALYDDLGISPKVIKVVFFLVIYAPPHTPFYVELCRASRKLAGPCPALAASARCRRSRRLAGHRSLRSRRVCGAAGYRARLRRCAHAERLTGRYITFAGAGGAPIGAFNGGARRSRPSAQRRARCGRVAHGAATHTPTPARGRPLR